MQPETVHLLQFNNETLFASKNITVLWHSLYNRCKSDGHRLPEAYATVRRRILAEGKYIHEPVLGYKYQIIERQLIKRPIQHKLGLFSQDTAGAIGGGKGVVSLPSTGTPANTIITPTKDPQVLNENNSTPPLSRLSGAV